MSQLVLDFFDFVHQPYGSFLHEDNKTPKKTRPPSRKHH